MNADLEAELMENPDLKKVVDRLRTAATVEPTREPAVPRWRRPFWRRPVAGLAAATLLLALGLSVVFLDQPPISNLQPSTSNLQPPTSSPCGAREYRLTAAEMIASQNADGSWQNDFLTRRNAEALRACDTPAARVAYKKALRNLRSRGIL